MPVFCIGVRVYSCLLYKIVEKQTARPTDRHIKRDRDFDIKASLHVYQIIVKHHRQKADSPNSIFRFNQINPFHIWTITFKFIKFHAIKTKMSIKLNEIIKIRCLLFFCFLFLSFFPLSLIQSVTFINKFFLYCSYKFHLEFFLLFVCQIWHIYI